MNETHAILLAAGKGERLGLTDDQKTMVEVSGKPLLAHEVGMLYKCAFGAKNITLVVKHQRRRIEEYFRADVQYREPETFEGTVVSLQSGMDGLSNDVETVLMMHADDGLFDDEKVIGNLLRFHERRRADVSVLLSRTFDSISHLNGYALAADNQLLGMFPIGTIRRQRNVGFFCGAACFSTAFLREYIPRVIEESREKQKKEIIIPDLYRKATAEKRPIYGMINEGPWIGINNRIHLAWARQMHTELG